MRLMVRHLESDQIKEIIATDFPFVEGVVNLLQVDPAVYYVDVVSQDGTMRYYREARPWPANPLSEFDR